MDTVEIFREGPVTIEGIKTVDDERLFPIRVNDQLPYTLEQWRQAALAFRDALVDEIAAQVAEAPDFYETTGLCGFFGEDD